MSKVLVQFKLFMFFLICTSVSVMAQSTDKKVADADRYFKIRNYEAALPLYKEAIENGVNDPIVYYRTAVSYENANNINEQIKSIPYFEKALATGSDQLPTEVYFDLANAYMKDENVEKAIETYGKYKEKVKGNTSDLKKAERALEIADNALAMMSSPKDIQIYNFGSVVNSEYTEYNPVVSADESVMAFTALRPNTGKTRSGDKFIEQIYISYNSSGVWSQPKLVSISSDYNVGTAGISADGQRMLIFIGGSADPGNIYSIDKSGDSWSNPATLGRNINSRSLETTASITPDGKTIYFASDRPGGYGGLDIYKATLGDNGEWGAPVNLGPEVNSKYNEDAPFIHPDQWTLFFTSDGHNTMGGRDIFVTRLFNDEWTAPENMGYPINTTANDNYFTLTADGRKGYFSSDRKGGAGGQDIYSIDMPEEEANIPLTMVKGKILNGETGEAMPTKIYIIDVESGKKLDFVYQPDPKTGNYLIILPPAKNYDMIIESEGFLPYTLNINVPGQTYFYELYQKILLNTIKQFDVVVGQQVEVKNAFYDTHEAAVTDVRKTHEAALVKNDSIDIYDLMNDLIAADDQAGIDYLVSLINMKNPVDDVSFDESSITEAASRVYYYDESDESKFEQKNVDGKTIFSLPTFYVTEEAKKQKNMNKNRATTYDQALLNKKVKVYFDVAKSDLKESYYEELNSILQTLEKHPELGIQISGYASAEGDKDFNRELSNKRAIEVLDYINRKGIVRRRIIARGQGVTKDENGSKEESRRVEVQFVDLNEHGRVVPQ
ncbi:OmpA family protein [Fulvivirga sediminis]|uniref:PD40 domain-containing protein n=1 Tax=Fulvivirga sediminis TaxID=2803949 RepID=A0A937JZK5_9BACT|nr:OmpA family protein [Fulvivirga sediminis]MBL3655301.1 PD40 domain-containing protein [Fulvivirga sediminis]